MSLNSILFTRYVCLVSFYLFLLILSSAQTWSLYCLRGLDLTLGKGPVRLYVLTSGGRGHRLFQ